MLLAVVVAVEIAVVNTSEHYLIFPLLQAVVLAVSNSCSDYFAVTVAAVAVVFCTGSSSSSRCSSSSGSVNVFCGTSISREYFVVVVVAVSYTH